MFRLLKTIIPSVAEKAAFQKNVSSIYVQLKNVVNDLRVKKVIKIGGDVAVALAPLSENPSPLNGIKAAFLIGKAFIDNLEVWAHDFFEDEGVWVEPFPRDFTSAIIKVLKKFPVETLKTVSEGSVIQIVNLDEGRVAWLGNTTKHSTLRIDRIYADAEKADAIREKIKQLLWEQFQGQPLILRRNTATFRNLDEDRVVLEVDDAFHPLPSKLADECCEYLRRAIDGGVNRSLMLYGPPGTGKSTMARKLVDDLNLRSFRIRIEDVGGLDNNTLFEAIEIFKPEAIILDDFDRTHGQEQLLETLEHFNRHIKLIVATVNRRDNLDEALLRPGRFDELVLVRRMDDQVIKKVLGPENLDAFNMIKDWPIAFVQEFVKRRKFMSKQEAMKSIKELADRVSRLKEYDDDISDAERILKRQLRKSQAKKANSVKKTPSQVDHELINAALEAQEGWDGSKGDDDDE